MYGLIFLVFGILYDSINSVNDTTKMRRKRHADVSTKNSAGKCKVCLVSRNLNARSGMKEIRGGRIGVRSEITASRPADLCGR